MKKYIKWFYLAAALFAFVFGFIVAAIGNQDGNPIMIAVGIAIMASGVYLFSIYNKTGKVRVRKGQQFEKGKEPNVLCVLPSEIKFQYKEPAEIIGRETKCLNDNKYYYVEHLSKIGEASVFDLPDDDENERAFDPKEMPNVIRMPANKKYFTWSASTMQKISIGIMGLIIAGEIVGLIAIP